MRKILLFTTALSGLATIIMASRIAPPRSPDFDSLFRQIPFGRVVKHSDIAGFGEIVELTNTNFYIQVDTPFYGCTNNQVILLRRLPESNKPLPETGRIVFAVFTNVYTLGYAQDWNDKVSEHDIERSVPAFIYNIYHGWFYPETEEAVFFTNIIHSIRVERNWTNYYEVVRSGFTNESAVIQRSAEGDLKNLILHNSSPDAYDTLLYMNNDPLFPESLKPVLNQAILEHAQ